MSAVPLRPLPATGEIAVVGLGRSGVAAVTLLRRHKYAVYGSDAVTTETTRMNAAALEAMGATIEIGGHDLERIQRAALVVASPGVPPDAAALVAARSANVEIVSEIELALRCMPPVPYIAITGTNGKTTTTALVAHLFRAIGDRVVEAGNIGTPFTEVALRQPLPQWVSLEMSSFQLHDTPSVAPVVGVLTNLSADHLDRYPSVDEYYADKRRLFANATAQSVWVVNGDDASAMQIMDGVAGNVKRFSVVSADAGPDAYYDRAGGILVVNGEPLLARADLPLLGDHNVANALTATLAVLSAIERQGTGARDLGDIRNRVASGLRTFRAPPHRMELVGDISGVQWINDSKATNVASAFVAISGMTRPTVLLLGGRHKGEPYTSLIAPIRDHVKHVLAYGEAAPRIVQDLQGVVPVEHLGSDFVEVMERARAIANAGDAVLLSPACSSFDMFANYEARGTRFRALAESAMAGNAMRGR